MKAAASAEGKKRFIHLGDRQGDFCAILKLGDDDFAMPRKDYRLCQLIYKNPLLIKAKIREWSMVMSSKRFFFASSTQANSMAELLSVLRQSFLPIASLMPFQSVRRRPFLQSLKSH
ncbi:hypothetical protein Scep_017445 [Stephania cephalantha]|uniref:Uncharacterized protein n=1 Tax=Stephania cephalantha TaxID=152367 RepID=A0AAP0IPL6_9MAGN